MKASPLHAQSVAWPRELEGGRDVAIGRGLDAAEEYCALVLPRNEGAASDTARSAPTAPSLPPSDRGRAEPRQPRLPLHLGVTVTLCA